MVGHTAHNGQNVGSNPAGLKLKYFKLNFKYRINGFNLIIMFICNSSTIYELTILPSIKLGYEYDFIKELLKKYNIIDILRFLKNIEQHFNIPLYDLIITPNIYQNISNKKNEHFTKTIIIIKFLKIIKNFFLLDNGLTLVKQLIQKSTPFAQKIKPILTLDNIVLKPLILGQTYASYPGSIIPFYVHTSSWYIRSGLLSDEN